MKSKHLTLALVLLLPLMPLAAAAGESIPSRSPENQIFQFKTTASFTYTGGKQRTATAYLWIPPQLQRVRGVLIAGRNVPEHWLVGHPAIRQACADSGLAILFACPTFFIPPQEIQNEADVAAFIQQLLSALADESGYDELRTVPWLPIGESYHLAMVKRVVNARPDRCIAAIQIKGGYLDIKPNSVPILLAIGTCDEWDQERKDMLNQWKTFSVHANHQKRRTSTPDYPGTLIIEPGSGHFECTEPMALYFADYIRAAAKVRLSSDGTPTLRPVDLNTGFIAGLPVPSGKSLPPTPYKQAAPEDRSLPWFFNAALAQSACEIAHVNWNAQTQIPVFADDAGKPLPFGRRGIFSPLPCITAPDGITFQLNSTFLETIPPGFLHAGTSLGHAPGKPLIEWICGHVIPLGNNCFQIALDRTWPDSPTFLRVWHPGDAAYRFSTQPGEIQVFARKQGTPQTITFAPIPDQRSTTKEIQLHATSDSNLPVRFFVRSGPAEIHGDRLLFTPIPPRSKMPLTVTVVAWQYGRTTEPAIQTAPLVERSFKLLPPDVP